MQDISQLDVELHVASWRERELRQQMELLVLCDKKHQAQ
jgi:hypothetical protein